MTYFDGGVQFRSSDEHGRPVDPSTETPTARAERIRALQDRWVPRELPSADPVAVLTDWMAASPQNRMGALAAQVAEHPERLPQAEMEPRNGERPVPGGLVEKLTEQERQRRAAIERANARGRMR
jgi:hypothetical protein